MLGFCPFDEYAMQVGLRLVGESLRWRSRPPSREFYHLLKLSLLEMRFDRLLPSASLGGMWLASRGPEARIIRKLYLGGFFSVVLSSFFTTRPMGRGDAGVRADGMTSVTRRAIECAKEVIPLDFEREVDM